MIFIILKIFLLDSINLFQVNQSEEIFTRPLLILTASLDEENDQLDTWKCFAQNKLPLNATENKTNETS